MMTTHLSANQIDAVLMGSAGRWAKTHLAACEDCRERVAAAAVPLKDFRAVAVAWSERKSATMPTSLTAALMHRAGVRQPLAWSAAALSLFAVGLFTTMAMPGTRVPEAAQVQGGKPAITSSLTAEDMASDNRMLNEIDRELGTSTDAGAPGVKDAPGAASTVEDTHAEL